jgi:hypothetical protein
VFLAKMPTSSGQTGAVDERGITPCPDHPITRICLDGGRHPNVPGARQYVVPAPLAAMTVLRSVPAGTMTPLHVLRLGEGRGLGEGLERGKGSGLGEGEARSRCRRRGGLGVGGGGGGTAVTAAVSV